MIDIHAIIDSGDPIDWAGLDPRDRAWLYIEKYKPGWLRYCRKCTSNWDEARDLFGDVVIMKVLVYSETFDEAFGASFPTYMYGNLSKKLLSVAAQRSKKKMIQFSAIEGSRINLDGGVRGGAQGRNSTRAPHLGHTDCNQGESDLKEAMRVALESLKAENEVTFRIFWDFAVEKYPKKTLASRYHCSFWLINEYIEAAKRHLKRCLPDY
jgi:hypothetical protein